MPKPLTFTGDPAHDRAVAAADLADAEAAAARAADECVECQS